LVGVEGVVEDGAEVGPEDVDEAEDRMQSYVLLFEVDYCMNYMQDMT
jgi:hypothetical protein